MSFAFCVGVSVPRRLARRSLSSAAAAHFGSRLSTLGGPLAGALPLLPLLEAQGRKLCDPAERRGLHPLVVPLASASPAEGAAAGDDGLIGVLLWPSAAGELTVVRAWRQGPLRLGLTACGSPAQFARRAAVEAEAAQQEEVMVAGSRAAIAAGGAAYTPGEHAASKLSLAQYLLLKVGPFPDVWAALVRERLAKADETSALVAAERAAATNPAWGAPLYAHALALGELGRLEERRDMSLSALECPFWTLGAPYPEVLRAAEQSHVEDLRALLREMEDRVRAQQNAPRSGRELALLRAMDAMDAVVTAEGEWDDCRPAVARGLVECGLGDAARIAESEG